MCGSRTTGHSIVEVNIWCNQSNEHHNTKNFANLHLLSPNLNHSAAKSNNEQFIICNNFSNPVVGFETHLRLKNKKTVQSQLLKPVSLLFCYYKPVQTLSNKYRKVHILTLSAFWMGYRPIHFPGHQSQNMSYFPLSKTGQWWSLQLLTFPAIFWHSHSRSISTEYFLDHNHVCASRPAMHVTSSTA